MALKQGTKQVPFTKATCDRCGTVTRPHCTCVGCGIHICRAHTHYLDIDPWTGSMAGDYPDRVCQSCFELMGPFAKEAQAITDAAADKADELKQQWIASCKAGGSK